MNKVRIFFSIFVAGLLCTEVTGGVFCLLRRDGRSEGLCMQEINYVCDDLKDISIDWVMLITCLDVCKMTSTISNDTFWKSSQVWWYPLESVDNSVVYFKWALLTKHTIFFRTPFFMYVWCDSLLEYKSSHNWTFYEIDFMRRSEPDLLCFIQICVHP